MNTELLHRLHYIEFEEIDFNTKYKVNQLIHRKYLKE